MRTNKKANQEYWPQLPAQFLTTNLHVAERQKMWILPIHLQYLFPNCPWCPQSYLLHWLLRSDYHLLRFPPTLSSCTLLPLWRPHPNRGQISNWGLHCSQEHPRQLPGLTRDWLHSHQKWNVILTSSSVVLNIFNNQWRG